MNKSKFTIFHVAVFIIILGVCVLGGIKLLSSNFLSLDAKEEAILSRVVGQIQKTVQNPSACKNTITKAINSYSPVTIQDIKSQNNFKEYGIGSKVTNSFTLSSISGQVVDKKKGSRLLILRLGFNRIKSKKSHSFMSFIRVSLKNRKITSCQVIGSMRY